MTSVNRASASRGSEGPKESSGGESGGLTSPEALIGMSVALTAASFIPMAAPIATPLRVAATVVAVAGVYQATTGGEEPSPDTEQTDAVATKEGRTDALKADGKGGPEVEGKPGAPEAPKVAKADDKPPRDAPPVVTLESHNEALARNSGPIAEVAPVQARTSGANVGGVVDAAHA